MARKKKKLVCPYSPSWMTTFADMNMLLLTFFVLLLSMATLDEVKIREAFGSLQGSDGILSTANKPIISENTPIPRVILTPSTPEQGKSEIYENVQELIQKTEKSNVISVIDTPEGVSIRIVGSVLFGNNGDALTDESRILLDNLVSIIKNSPYKLINIEGHTSDTAPPAPWRSNWDLSAARASTVLTYFVDKGRINPSRLSMTAFGEYHPLLPNISKRNRGINDRVEINLFSSDYSSVRPIVTNQ